MLLAVVVVEWWRREKEKPALPATRARETQDMLYPLLLTVRQYVTLFYCISQSTWPSAAQEKNSRNPGHCNVYRVVCNSVRNTQALKILTVVWPLGELVV